MGCKRRIVSAAVIHMEHKRHIQDLCFKFCIFPVLTQHHKNVLCGGKVRIRCINIQVLAPSVVICMIAVHHQHGELADQVQALAQYIRYTGVICLVVIGIQLQNTSRDAVHHIAAGRLQNHIPHKIRRKRTPLPDHFLEIL